jgi:hypothetical protein
MAAPTRVRAHIRSNVVGYVAVFIALSGSAVALPGKGTVQSNDIKRNAVKAKHVKDGQLTGTDVAGGSLGAREIDEADLDPSVLQARVLESCPGDSSIQAITPAGAVACNQDQTGPETAGLLTGRINQLGDVATRFVPPQGTSTPTATAASQVAHGSPAGQQTVLGDLQVVLSSDLGNGQTREFTVVVASGLETELSCEISAGESICGDTGPVAIPAGIGFALKLDSSGNGLGTNESATFGMEASH